MDATVSLGRSYNCSIFPLWMESNALEKSANKSVTSRFCFVFVFCFLFFCTNPFRIRRIVRIWDFVDRFLRKLFCFFQRTFSRAGLKMSSCRAWEILAAMEVRLYHGNFWQFRGHISWGRGGCSLSFISLLWSNYIRRCSIRAVDCRISLFSILLVVFHQDRLLSCV